MLKTTGGLSADDVDDDEELTDELDQLEFEGVQPRYEDQLREVSAVDDGELARKRMFTKEPFVDLMEFMLEDTLFNLMEEATY